VISRLWYCKRCIIGRRAMKSSPYVIGESRLRQPLGMRTFPDSPIVLFQIPVQICESCSLEGKQQILKGPRHTFCFQAGCELVLCLAGSIVKGQIANDPRPNMENRYILEFMWRGSNFEASVFYSPWSQQGMADFSHS
jgi:hypothetical protein